MSIDNRQPPQHPLRSHPPGEFASPPAPPVPAQSPLRLLTTEPLPVLHLPEQLQSELHPQPLISNLPDYFIRPPSPLLTSPPSPKSTRTSSKSSKSWFADTGSLVTARCHLLEECSGGLRSTKILNRMDKNTGKILPALPTSPATEETELNTVYYLRSLSRSIQRARVGDPERNINLLPSEPLVVLRKKLHEGVIEKRRLQRREETSKGRPRRAMSTLRALMLNFDKQAEMEYFQRREEEEQAKKEASKNGSE